MKAYFTRVIGAFSQLMNVTFLFGKRTNESISARCYRKGTLEGSPLWRKAHKAIDWIAQKIESEHCKTAYQDDLRQAHKLINEAPKGVFLHPEK
jgi:hypothetical protein